LAKAKNLKSLSLLNVQINDIVFIGIIKRNINLQALYLECCQNITEESMKEIPTNGKIANFSIKDCPLIKGKFI
jgi:hypothetical protein